MELQLLTDTIFIQDNRMLYHTNKDDIKQIKNHNWHKILKECGWEKLSPRWIKKLNKQLKTPINNSLFGCLDCGGDGDCLFQCISHSLNTQTDEEFPNYDAKEIRKIIADNITEPQYSQIIEYYRILKDTDEFEEHWDPYLIQTKEDLCQQILQEGNHYWGDFLLLQVLSSILKINCLILNCDSFNGIYEIYPTMIEYNSEYKTIILLYEDNIHFRLAGYFKDTIF